MKIKLCGDSPSLGCPMVEVKEYGVFIGEDDNVCRLSLSEWNLLVEKIKKGELKEVE